jgi:CMP-N-acetylneuraminic acid synthetase
MIDNRKVYALIPARGGSKGIPYKSIALLNNRPLLSYAIHNALKSSYIDRIIVSTDDEKIAAVAKQYDAEVPFMRPACLAQDDSSAYDYIIHALEFFRDEELYLPDVIVILQPTSPFLLPEDIDNALKLFVDRSANALTSLYKPDISPYWFKKVNENNIVKDLMPQPASYIRRQDNEGIFLLNGAIYIYNVSAFLENCSKINNERLAYIMPSSRSIDIDTEEDLQFAEFLLKKGTN